MWSKCHSAPPLGSRWGSPVRLSSPVPTLPVFLHRSLSYNLGSAKIIVPDIRRFPVASSLGPWSLFSVNEKKQEPSEETLNLCKQPCWIKLELSSFHLNTMIFLLIAFWFYFTLSVNMFSQPSPKVLVRCPFAFILVSNFCHGKFSLEQNQSHGFILIFVFLLLCLCHLTKSYLWASLCTECALARQSSKWPTSSFLAVVPVWVSRRDMRLQLAILVHLSKYRCYGYSAQLWNIIMWFTYLSKVLL